jgi:hypothetical protein
MAVGVPAPQCKRHRVHRRARRIDQHLSEFLKFIKDHLEIVCGGTSETLRATVVHPGEARVPCPVLMALLERYGSIAEG